MKAGTKSDPCVYKQTVVGYTFEVDLELSDHTGAKQAYSGDVGAFECNGRWFLRGATPDTGKSRAAATDFGPTE